MNPVHAGVHNEAVQGLSLHGSFVMYILWNSPLPLICNNMINITETCTDHVKLVLDDTVTKLQLHNIRCSCSMNTMIVYSIITQIMHHCVIDHWSAWLCKPRASVAVVAVVYTCTSHELLVIIFLSCSSNHSFVAVPSPPL